MLKLKIDPNFGVFNYLLVSMMKRVDGEAEDELTN